MQDFSKNSMFTIFYALAGRLGGQILKSLLLLLITQSAITYLEN